MPTDLQRLKLWKTILSAKVGRDALLSSDGEVVGSVVSCRLRSFDLQTAANNSYGVLATDVQVHGLSIDVTQAALDPRHPAQGEWLDTAILKAFPFPDVWEFWR